MSYSLSLGAVVEKNLIASDKAYLVCLEIDVRDPSTNVVHEVIRIVNNTEDVTVNSSVYSAFGFSIDLKSESGGQPTVGISIEDVTRAIHAKMQAYGGGIGFYVRIMIVSENDLSSPPEIVENFEVISSSTSDYMISWTLGTQNLLARKFPNRRQLKDRCTWEFKGEQCGYAGADATCDYSLQGANGCGVKNNSKRFGGFPGIRSNGMRYV
jgi:hypothetical protein